MPTTTPSHEPHEGVDEAYQLFLQDYKARESRHSALAHTHERVVRDKHTRLIPMRQLLKRLVDLSVQVHHAETYSSSRRISQPPQPLEVYEDTSSAPWHPGQSLFLEHPAKIEIAVPNAHQESTEGQVVIRISTEHPESHLLTRRFDSMKDACVAMARFLSFSTVKIDRIPPPSHS